MSYLRVNDKTNRTLSKFYEIAGMEIINGIIRIWKKGERYWWFNVVFNIERKEFLYIVCLISVVCNLLVWFDLFHKKNIRRTSDRMVKKVVGLLSASEYGGKI